MQKKVYFCSMILNYIWIFLILLAVLMGLVQAVAYGNVDIFSTILNSTFDSAKTGFELSLGLTGVLSLWMGIMRIGEQAGAVHTLGKAINPFFSRIFPEIPKGHPVFGSMLMNIAANMLGLDNAATPMGLKAMGELQELNTDKTKASNAMIMFVVLGASGLTLIPTTIMAYRAQLGAENPADVFLPILIATYAATLVGLISVCIAQKIRMKDPVVLGTIIGLTALVGLLVWGATLLSPKTLSTLSAAGAAIILLGIICWFILLESGIAWCFEACGINPDLAGAVPTALMKPLSGGGARGLMLEAMTTHGADSLVGRLCCILQGTTDTTFYVLAVYFGSVNIKDTRHAVACCLLADLAGVVTAFAIAPLFFG